MAASRLTMSGIRKAFGPTAALRGVDLDLRSGEVHALVGENGAGKSTLMKVLSGAERPDAGSMTLDGRAYAKRVERMLHMVVRLLLEYLRFEITLLETAEGGTRAEISRDGPLPSVRSG